MSDLSGTPTRNPPDDVALAWELVTAARPQLRRAEADRIYIAIGVGDTFDAIAALIAIIARDRVALGRGVTVTAVAWLDRYRGHHAEPRLRALLTTIQPSSAATTRTP